MHPIFSVTLFTGQQLVLEAIQRWLQRPCADAEAHRQRRLGLKGLVTLLLRTAATGVLATLLDAAIEFRRRQLLAAAAAEPGDVAVAAAAGGGGSRFPGLGMVSRAGVAAWKGRLLLCIDELERRAEAYGIESRHRFSEGKPVDDDADDDEQQEAAASATGASGKSATASSLAALARAGSSRSSSSLDLSGEESSQHLGRTVEQLRELVKQGDPDSERRLDEEAGSLVDILLGIVPLPPSPSIAASRSLSVPSALDRLGSCAGLRASRSRASLTGAAAAAPATGFGCEEQASPSSPTGSGGGCYSSDLCQICMDRPITVQVAGCQHDLCFGCARRLCASQDHAAPQCPFCRQAINGFQAIPNDSPSSGGAVACSAAATAPACIALRS